MNTDPVSTILELLQARCLLGGGLVAGGRWVRHFGQPNAIKVMAQIEGRCWLAIGSLDPVPLETGDVILVNGRHLLSLASDPAMLRRPDNSVSIVAMDDITRIGETRDFFMLGGHIAVDASRHTLVLDMFPPLIHIGGSADEAKAMRWLLEQLAHEWNSGRPGAAAATSHLAQLMFVQALRAHLRSGAEATKGWLRGLGDERIAPAFGLMHMEPARAWTLAELARASGMSRTSFALRFKTSVGMSPLAYLTQWRMRMAERDLRQGDTSISSLAYRLGYASESAFSTAFKRVTGVAPAHYRQAARNTADATASPQPVEAF